MQIFADFFAMQIPWQWRTLQDSIVFNGCRAPEIRISCNAKTKENTTAAATNAAARA
jgi:hypothetical protein